MLDIYILYILDKFYIFIIFEILNILGIVDIFDIAYIVDTADIVDIVDRFDTFDVPVLFNILDMYLYIFMYFPLLFLTYLIHQIYLDNWVIRDTKEVWQGLMIYWIDHRQTDKERISLTYRNHLDLILPLKFACVKLLTIFMSEPC